MQELFISNENLPPFFSSAVHKLGYKLTSQSLISFEKVNFKLDNFIFNWIFFTSKRSVDFFIDIVNINTDQYKIACIGNATANHLLKKGINPEFIGNSAGEPEKVAKEFKSILGDQTVLFPISNKSKKTISNALAPEQKLEVITYNTVTLPQHFTTHFDCLVFTSPSNAESYLIRNKIDASQKVVAWGKTTQAYLKQRSIYVNNALTNSSYEELLEILEG